MKIGKKVRERRGGSQKVERWGRWNKRSARESVV